MPQLSETFVVTERRTLRLPLVREISLRGVLRSELEEHLRTELSRFVNDPQVEAQPLTRIAILGAVPRPGFYTAGSELLIGDAVMLAGGPASNIPLNRVRIERAGGEVISGEEVELAIAEGRTLEDLDVRSGDQIRVQQPSRWMGSIQSSLSWLTMLTSIPITIFTVTRLF
jgi:protein involved in polysaccharide export with SLBB domain